jgi:sortase B
MKSMIRRVLTMLLSVVLVGSVALTLRQLYHYAAADSAYSYARSEAGASGQEAALEDPEVPLADQPPAEEPLDENARLLTDIDLDALRQTNRQVLGWIQIPGTSVSYPLMDSQDNSDYLHLAWDGTSNSAGSIFLECQNQRDLSDFNTIIYGHRMRNGSMFGELRHYSEQDFAEANPSVYIVTDDSIRRYDIFSAYEAGVTTDTYRLRFTDDDQRQTAIDSYLDRSVIESDLVPTVEDSILTLSTCTGKGTYDTRWVVQAVLTAQWSR